MVDIFEDDIVLSARIFASCAGLYCAGEAGESDLVVGSTEEDLVIAVKIVDVDSFR